MLENESLMIEVAVRCGDVTAVSLSTVIEISHWKTAPSHARAKILSVVDLLVKALPVTEVKGLENEYTALVKCVGVNAKGGLCYVDPEIQQAEKEQEELKKKIKLEDEDVEPR